MNIGFITPEYPSPLYNGAIGGIGSFVGNLAKQLVRKGHKVFVFVYGQSKGGVTIENGVHLHLVKMERFPGLTWYINRKHFNKYVQSIVHKEKIDVLEAPDWTGFTAFMRFSCPLVIRLHGSDTFFCHLEDRKQKKKNYFFEKRALSSASKIVAVSEFVRTKTSTLFSLSNRNIEVIYNTVDHTQFKVDHSDIKPKTILYFGTLIRKKGVLELSQIFNKVVSEDSDFTLTFVGKDAIDALTNTSTKALCVDRIDKNARKNVTFIDHVNQKELRAYIQTSEIIALPSFAEAFPMTWLEAMALEKKIITSDIGWSKEIMIDEETGYTASPKDHNVFAKKILALNKYPDKSEVMAKNARTRIINDFNSAIILEMNINMYQKTILNE